MAKRKTAAEIAAEVAALKELLPKLPNQRSAIKAQIRVLENDLSNDDVYDEFQGTSRFDDTLDVCMWRDGDSECEPMSIQWRELL